MVARIRDIRNVISQQKRKYIRQMASARSYYEWSLLATKLDALDGGADVTERWKKEITLYDRNLLREKLVHLRHVKHSGTIADSMFAIRADLIRNLGGIASKNLHEHFPLIPEPIREYIGEVCSHLEAITHSPELPLEEKGAFLKETRHAFGRTCLMLSGGGGLGAFHLGVVKALLEHSLLPRVLAGSSIGAIVAALAATKTDIELEEFLQTQSLQTLDPTFFSSTSLPSTLGRLSLQLTASSASSSSSNDTLHSLQIKRLRHLLGDATFADAYQKTGRVLNISVVTAHGRSEPRLLNYLTTPHIVIWSAVACSVSTLADPAPELYSRNASGELQIYAADGGSSQSAGKQTWRDGSLAYDGNVAAKGLSGMFSVNHYVTSQTSPALVPLLSLRRVAGTAGVLFEGELRHRCQQLLQLIPFSVVSAPLRVFARPWEGDITILPPAAPCALGSLGGLDCHDLLAIARAGELATWAKLSAIQSNCGIEVTLDACIQSVATWERAEKKKREGVQSKLSQKHRVPSMRALSVPCLSRESLMSAFEDDGVYDGAENDLPLPEETPVLGTVPPRNTLKLSRSIHMPITASDCGEHMKPFMPSSDEEAKKELAAKQSYGGGLDMLAF